MTYKYQDLKTELAKLLNSNKKEMAYKLLTIAIKGRKC